MAFLAVRLGLHLAIIALFFAAPGTAGVVNTPEDYEVYRSVQKFFYLGPFSFPKESLALPIHRRLHATAESLPGSVHLEAWEAVGSIRAPGDVDAFPLGSSPFVASGNSAGGRGLLEGTPAETPLNGTVAKPGTVLGFDGLDAWAAANAGTGAKYKNTDPFSPPPDVAGCVGNGYIVEIVNSAIAVYGTNRTVVVAPTSLNQFFKLPHRLTFVAGKAVLGDKIMGGSCIYDRDTRRFFFALSWTPGEVKSPWDNFGQTRRGNWWVKNHGSATIIGVSAELQPHLPWTVFYIPGTNDGQNSPNDEYGPLWYEDQSPFLVNTTQIGMDTNGIYVTNFQYGTDTLGDLSMRGGANIYAIAKRRLFGKVSHTCLRYAIPDRSEFTSQVLQPLAPVPPVADKLAPFDTRFGGVAYFATYLYTATRTRANATLIIIAITNTSALNSHDLFGASIHLEFIDPPAFRTAPLTLQKDGPTPYGTATRNLTQPDFMYASGDGSDSQAPSAAWSKGGLFLTFTVGVCCSDTGPIPSTVVAHVTPSVSPDPTSTTGDVMLRSTLTNFVILSVLGESLVYPALSFNGAGRGVLAFTLVGPGFFPTAAYATLWANGTVDTKVNIAALGRAPLDSAEGTPLRYGDWHKVTVDEKGTFWSFVEYVNGKLNSPPKDTARGWSNWATRIFQVTL